MFIIYAIIYILTILVRRLFKSTIKKCNCKTSMKGKNVIVTGASSGIGYHTALKLAARGARTILACRNIAKGNKAKNDIVSATGNSNVIVKEMDLTKLNSIRDFVEDILATGWNIDVLINNAGAFSPSDSRTEDGLLEGIQVNHYGPFLLTLLLLPKLKKSQPSRVINVSSLAYLFGYGIVDALKIPSWTRINTYADSKRCNLIFHLELARRLRGSGVVVNSVHPGITQTNIMNEAFCCLRIIFGLACWFIGRTPEDGAETVVHLAVSNELENVTGKFFMDLTDIPVLESDRDVMLADKIWSISEKCVNYNINIPEILRAPLLER